MTYQKRAQFLVSKSENRIERPVPRIIVDAESTCECREIDH